MGNDGHTVKLALPHGRMYAARGLGPLFYHLMTMVIVLFSLASSCLQSSAQPQPVDSSFVQTVNELEGAVGLAGYDYVSLVDRVSALELKVFGQVHGGALSYRLSVLRKTLFGEGGPNQNSQPSSAQNINEERQGDLFLKKNPGQSIDNQGSSLKSAVSPTVTAVHSNCNLPASPGKTNAPKLDSVLPLKNLQQVRFVRIEMPYAKEKITGDYYQDVVSATHGLVLRFKNMPIPVYIAEYPESEFTSSCINGFEVWEDRTNGVIRFVQVDDPNQARIRVIWSKLGVSSDPKGCTLGAHTITKWKARPAGNLSSINVAGVVPVPLYLPKLGPKFSVPPQIIEVNLDLIHSKNLEIRYQILENVVAHELGHALGILGHSPWKTDLMYPVTDEHSRLSQRDINTVLKLYQQKVDIPL